MVKDLFQIQREFILCSTGFNYGENSECGIRYLASPVGSGPAQAAKMREIKAFASRHAYSPHAPHLHFVADTIGSVGWIVAGDRPSHFIRESYDGGKHHVKHVPGIEKMAVFSIFRSKKGVYHSKKKMEISNTTENGNLFILKWVHYPKCT